MRQQQIINNYLNRVDKGDAVYIDIGASTESNLSDRIVKQSKKTVFIEPLEHRASHWKRFNSDNFVIINDFARPQNIVSLLDEHIQDNDITYLDIDIDGYDYFVLEALLKYKKPVDRDWETIF